MSEDSCFYNSVPAEAVTVAILKCASFHSLFYFMNRKKIFYTNSVSIGTLCSVTTVQSVVFRP